jgi:hypothetical protein
MVAVTIQRCLATRGQMGAISICAEVEITNRVHASRRSSFEKIGRRRSLLLKVHGEGCHG